MANEKGQKEPEKKDVDIDFGIGSMGFGGLFKGIGNIIDLASRLQEQGGEISRAGEIEFGQKGLKDLKGIYGFTIKTMAGGSPTVESFGNIKETPKGPVVDEMREPIVDVFDEKNEIVVIAELPGINKNDVKIGVKGDVLTISAEGKIRKYNKEVLLPGEVDPTTLRSIYKNGILEIKMAKK